MMTSKAIFTSFIRPRKSGKGTYSYYILIPIEIFEAYEFLKEAVKHKKRVRVIVEALDE